jgi:hypothetical protein
MKDNNSYNSITNSTTSSSPTPPNPREANDALLSLSNAAMLSGSYRQAGAGSSSPLTLTQSGACATNREQIHAILEEALVVISDSDSSDFVSDANTPCFPTEFSRRQ